VAVIQYDSRPRPECNPTGVEESQFTRGKLYSKVGFQRELTVIRGVNEVKMTNQDISHSVQNIGMVILLF